MVSDLTLDDWFKLLMLVEDDNQRLQADEEPEDTELEQKLLDIVYGRRD